MNNNYLSTIPQFADNLRTKGYQKPNPVHFNHEPTESSNPAQKQYRNKWNEEAIQNVHNRLESIDKAKKLMITEREYPKRSKNTAQMPFQTSQNMPSFSETNRSGGANVTSSSRLTDQDYETYRKKLLQNRLLDYERLAAGPQVPSLASSILAPSATTRPALMRPVQVIAELSDIDKSNLDLLIQSIEQKVSKGITDENTYLDILKLGQFFTFNIYKYNEITELITILRRLEELEVNVSTDIENKDGDRLSNRNTNDIKYAKLIEVTLNNLIDYVRINSGFIGRSTKERQVLARSTLKPLNVATKVIPNTVLADAARLAEEDVPEAAQEQQQQLPQVGGVPQEEGGPALPPYVPRFGERVPLPTDQSFQPSQYDKPTLRRILYKLGVPFYAVDSADVITKLIYKYMDPTYVVQLSTRQINDRVRNPTLWTPETVGNGRKGRKGGNWFTDHFKPDSTLRSSIIPTATSAAALAGMLLAPEVTLPYAGALAAIEALGGINSFAAQLGYGRRGKKGGNINYSGPNSYNVNWATQLSKQLQEQRNKQPFTKR